MLPIRAILCPVDFSDPSLSAFQVAVSLARDWGARLVALHVVPKEIVYSGLIGGPTPDLYRAELHKQLDQLPAPELAKPVEHWLREGDPVHEILGAATESHCDLIVMASHGRTGINRLLMGSVAEAVLHRAPCSVLTIKQPSEALHAAGQASRQEA